MPHVLSISSSSIRQFNANYCFIYFATIRMTGGTAIGWRIQGSRGNVRHVGLFISQVGSEHNIPFRVVWNREYLTHWWLISTSFRPQNNGPHIIFFDSLRYEVHLNNVSKFGWCLSENILRLCFKDKSDKAGQENGRSSLREPYESIHSSWFWSVCKVVYIVTTVI
jgi:hypothetical protein